MSIVTSMTTGVSEREANDALNAYVSMRLPRPTAASLKALRHDLLDGDCSG